MGLCVCEFGFSIAGSHYVQLCMYYIIEILNMGYCFLCSLVAPPSVRWICILSYLSRGECSVWHLFFLSCTCFSAPAWFCIKPCSMVLHVFFILQKNIAMFFLFKNYFMFCSSPMYSKSEPSRYRTCHRPLA
jgi:hypothetical protein